MGTHSYTVYGNGKTSEEAFSILSDNAAYEHGHEEGYSGYINCTYFCGTSKIDQKKFTQAAVQRWVDKHLHELDKRECIALEIPKSAKWCHAHSSRRGVKTFLFCVAAPC